MGLVVDPRGLAMNLVIDARTERIHVTTAEWHVIGLIVPHAGVGWIVIIRPRYLLVDWRVGFNFAKRFLLKQMEHISWFFQVDTL